jgi:hypothetical protein
MAVRDSHTEMLRVHGYRAMTPQHRFDIARRLTREGRWIALNMARQRHPRDNHELEFELWNRIYGRRVAAQALALPRGWNSEAEPMEESAVVYEVVKVLEDLGVPYAIVGGYSAIFWGRPRTTQDADLVIEIPPSRIDALVRALDPHFVVSSKAAQDAARLHGEFNAIHRTEVFKVDLWVAGTAFDQEVLRRRRREQLTPELAAFVQSPEDTILSKLRWCKLSNMSERQFSDVLGVYEIQEPTLDQRYLDEWASRLDIADLLARVRQQAARGD